MATAHRPRSERRALVKGCWMKRRYKDRIVALRAAERWTQRVYACDECRGWHLTKQRVQEAS